MAAFDKKQMDAIVSRFLGWKLPKTFSPDCWISFKLPKENYDKPGFWPVGTNLLNADEARAMLEHVLDVTFIPDWSLLEATQASLREHMAAMKELRTELAKAQAIANEMFIDQRGDGPWLVCVEKVFDTEQEARAACVKWQEATGGVAAVEAPSRREQVLQILHCADAYGDARIMASKGRVDRSEVNEAREELRELVERTLGVPEAPAPHPKLLAEAVQFLTELTEKDGGLPPIQQTATVVVLRALAVLGVGGNGNHTNCHEPLMKDDPT